MISMTKLLCGDEYFGDTLRYSEDAGCLAPHGVSPGRGPVVVWNCTKTCNLRCRHCYSNSDNERYSGELTTTEALAFIGQLADFNVPVLLLSGGEPLMRPDLEQLIAAAVELGIRVTLSSNGTLLTPEKATRLRQLGIGYIGVSLDGIGENNDNFRGRKGAYEAALTGIRNCIAVGQRVGLRFTINKYNYQELNSIFDLIEKENIPRICFYHLVYSGRGGAMMEEDLTHEETRAAVDLIIDRTLDFHRRGLKKEILTVDNHADGVYVYMKLKETDPDRAEQVKSLLRSNGGNRTGMAIGAVDWFGYVHPDQFTQDISFGNVREKSFGEIWTDGSQPVLAGLKNRKPLLQGRCAACCWLELCNGNFRARAAAVSGSFWAEDPACYLTDQEIEAVPSKTI